MRWIVSVGIKVWGSDGDGGVEDEEEGEGEGGKER